MKKLKTFKGLKKGTRIKVVTNSNSHNYGIGSVYSLARDGIGALMEDIAGTGRHNNLDARDCVLCDETISGLQKELETLKAVFEKESKELSDKIKFCQDNNLEEYDANYHKVLTAISVLDGKATVQQKAAVIAALLND